MALGKGKPVALGEVGEIPDREILDQQPRWSWFMPWGWILFISNEPELIRDVYNSERVLTMDEVTVEQNGKYIVNIRNN